MFNSTVHKKVSDINFESSNGIKRHVIRWKSHVLDERLEFYFGNRNLHIIKIKMFLSVEFIAHLIVYTSIYLLGLYTNEAYITIVSTLCTVYFYIALRNTNNPSRTALCIIEFWINEKLFQPWNYSWHPVVSVKAKNYECISCRRHLNKLSDNPHFKLPKR